jgi:hypothetical protein
MVTAIHSQKSSEERAFPLLFLGGFGRRSLYLATSLPLLSWNDAAILAKLDSSLGLRVALIGHTIGRETVNTCGSCAFWLASA